MQTDWEITKKFENAFPKTSREIWTVDKIYLNAGRLGTLLVPPLKKKRLLRFRSEKEEHGVNSQSRFSAIRLNDLSERTGPLSFEKLFPFLGVFSCFGLQIWKRRTWRQFTKLLSADFLQSIWVTSHSALALFLSRISPFLYHWVKCEVFWTSEIKIWKRRTRRNSQSFKCRFSAICLSEWPRIECRVFVSRWWIVLWFASEKLCDVVPCVAKSFANVYHIRSAEIMRI